MFKFLDIEEEFEILDFLQKRNLVEQYKKAKSNILIWNFWWNKIDYRKPKKDNIIYFRINKQFRAYWHIEWNKLVVFAINNHQNW